MKRAVISALIIAALAATGLFLYADTKAAAADVTARLAELEKTPDLSAARELSKKWEDFCSRNIFLTNNECAFEISQVLVRITAGIETGELLFGGDVDPEGYVGYTGGLPYRGKACRNIRTKLRAHSGECVLTTCGSRPRPLRCRTRKPRL